MHKINITTENIYKTGIILIIVALIGYLINMLFDMSMLSGGFALCMFIGIYLIVIGEIKNKKIGLGICLAIFGTLTYGIWPLIVGGMRVKEKTVKINNDKTDKERSFELAKLAVIFNWIGVIIYFITIFVGFSFITSLSSVNFNEILDVSSTQMFVSGLQVPDQMLEIINPWLVSEISMLVVLLMSFVLIFLSLGLGALFIASYWVFNNKTAYGILIFIFGGFTLGIWPLVSSIRAKKHVEHE